LACWSRTALVVLPEPGIGVGRGFSFGLGFGRGRGFGCIFLPLFSFKIDITPLKSPDTSSSPNVVKISSLDYK
jgi:hypothetical protein